MRRWLLVAAAGAVVPASAQSIQVSGTVTTRSGKPVPSCLAVLANAGSPRVYSVSTSAIGGYSFSQVPANVKTLYTLRVICNKIIFYQGVIPRPGLQQPIRLPLP